MKEIIVSYDPEFNPNSGVQCTVSWENPELLKALKLLFDTRPNEKIIGLKVTDSGISATFQTLK